MKYFVQIWVLSFQIDAKYPHAIIKDDNSEEQMTDEEQTGKIIVCLMKKSEDLGSKGWFVLQYVAGC